MRTLYHSWLCPFSRKVRVTLGEIRLDFDLVLEKAWERRPAFLAMNPAGEVPVLQGPDGEILTDSTAICELLDEQSAPPSLFGADPFARAEARRLVAWFDLKFHREVTRHLVDEKITKRLRRSGEPNPAAIRAGYANIRHHLEYVGYLTERRNWLAGGDFSMADIAAAAQFSCNDYAGDVPWEEFPNAKTWYARIKSRPSFRPILADHVPGIPPPRHYADLDF